MERQISSIEQLQQEKSRILKEREICKDLFFESLNNTKENAGSLLKKAILPAGIIGIALPTLIKLIASSKDPQHNSTNHSNNNWLLDLAPIVVPLIMNYFHAKEVEEQNG